jgi:antitoxin component YwqK of YwqJK toxin-antitoxin module
MGLRIHLCSVSLFVLHIHLAAQPEQELLAQDEHYVMGDVGADPSPDLNVYEAFNGAIGGDSVRLCGGHPCIGWVEDNYPDGTLKHRGYYDQGRLTLYKNYHINGAVEREFRSTDAVKSTLRTYHGNGQLRSETRFVDGVSVSYHDHYVNGVLRYAEERHRSEPYFIRMDLFAADGHPISTLQLVDKKSVEFEQREYHPGGALRAVGRAQYDPARMDTRRINTWIFYDVAGTVVKEEDYLDGRIASMR